MQYAGDLIWLHLLHAACIGCPWHLRKLRRMSLSETTEAYCEFAQPITQPDLSEMTNHQVLYLQMIYKVQVCAGQIQQLP